MCAFVRHFDPSVPLAVQTSTGNHQNEINDPHLQRVKNQFTFSFTLFLSHNCESKQKSMHRFKSDSVDSKFASQKSSMKVRTSSSID